MKSNRFHEIERRFCPTCHRPMAILRGLDERGQPIMLPTHRVDPKGFVLGVQRIG